MANHGRKGEVVRDVLALDFPAQWKKALKEKVLPQYSNFSTMASLARHVLEEFILTHMHESVAREWGLLASYQSIGRPDVLLFAIRTWEQLRAQEKPGRGEAAGETGVQPEPQQQPEQQTIRRKSGKGR